MMKKKNLRLLLSFLIITVGNCFAQDFRFKARLDSVKDAGFYTIQLTPAITEHLKTDYSDLRIADESGRWIPFIIRNGLATVTKEQIIEFPILSNKFIDSGRTEIILKNTSDSFVNKLRLFLKNTTVSRNGVISGSTDLKNWYIISPIFINRSFETTATEYIQECRFIPSDYQYFKLVINNLQNDPVNILRAGIYTKAYFEPPQIFTSHQNTRFQIKEEGNKTIVTVSEPETRHIGQLCINISAPKYYSRSLTIHLPDEQNKPGELIASYDLQSSACVEFPVVKTQTILMVINNRDNPPLTINTVAAAEPNMFATAYLDEGHQYLLLMESDSAMQPDFDLIHFKDSIPTLVQFAYPAQVTAVESSAKKAFSFFQQWFIWPVLFGVLLILFLLVKGLLKDMKNSNTSNS